MGMFDLDWERHAIGEAIKSLDHQRFVSRDQVGGLTGLVKQGLENKTDENRIAVMGYLIGDAIHESLGVEFHSFKNISCSTATFMIELLREPQSKPWRLNAYGRQLIAAAEGRVKAHLTA